MRSAAEWYFGRSRIHLAKRKLFIVLTTAFIIAKVLPILVNVAYGTHDHDVNSAVAVEGFSYQPWTEQSEAEYQKTVSGCKQPTDRHIRSSLV